MAFRFLTAFRLQSICQPFKWLGRPFTRNISPLEQLCHPFIGDINPFKQLSYPFIRYIKQFERLGHPFVEDIRPFERLGHLYYGITLNFLPNDLHGRRVTLFLYTSVYPLPLPPGYHPWIAWAASEIK